MAGKYVRVKIYTKDNLTLSYSPLRAGESEQFLKDQHEVIALPVGEARQEKVNELVYRFVAMGLTNAGDERWDVVKVRLELDKVVINELQELIMAESGLIVPNLPTPASP